MQRGRYYWTYECQRQVSWVSTYSQLIVTIINTVNRAAVVWVWLWESTYWGRFSALQKYRRRRWRRQLETPPPHRERPTLPLRLRPRRGRSPFCSKGIDIHPPAWPLPMAWRSSRPLFLGTIPHRSLAAPNNKLSSTGDISFYHIENLKSLVSLNPSSWDPLTVCVKLSGLWDSFPQGRQNAVCIKLLIFAE